MSLSLIAAVLTVGFAAGETVVEIPAWRETAAAAHGGDAADDPAIWVNAAAPQKSLLFGADKAGGLMVMDLEGRQLQYLDGLEPNNVDLRSGIVIGGAPRTVVAASDRKGNTIAAWLLDEGARTLSPLPVDGCKPEMEVYGFCLYHNPANGKLFGFITSKFGKVEQWELQPKDGETALTATRVRVLDAGAQCEGAAADDEAGVVYIGVEEVAVLKIDAAPDGGTEFAVVDRAQPEGRLAADIEGIAVTDKHLVVSCQGDSTYCVYERAGGNAYVGRFRIGAGEGIDAVTGTDGIEVSAANLGPGLEQGLLVTQDDKDDKGHQNFKLVPWGKVLSVLK